MSEKIAAGAAELFRELLDPVVDVAGAWRAFAAFVTTDIAGVAENDGDGFIIQWGRFSWDLDQPCLSLTRQLDVGEHLWHVELTMLFADGDGADGDTGFRFDRSPAALDEACAEARANPFVSALWSQTPISSEVTVEHVCG